MSTTQAYSGSIEPNASKLIADADTADHVTMAHTPDQETVSLLRWLRRQLRQPTPERERLEAAVANDDPDEARRLLARYPFGDAQRKHVEGLIDRWEARRGPR